MNLKAKNNIETNKYELELEVSAEELNSAINAVFKKESQKMNIPGFRKGKAPRAFIEKYYGEEVFFEPAIDHLYRPMMNEAVEKSELEVVSVTGFNVEEISKANGVKVKVTVVVKPEVSIKDYKGITATKEPVVVTDAEVDADIEKVRERNSRLIDIDDRAAQDGDIVTIDFDGSVDGVAFDGGKAEHHELTLGAGQFIPGFEEQVVGHKIDEEFDVNVKFPADYHAEELKDKDAVFKIKLHHIKMKELPDVDDEFVKDVSEFDTLDEYKADVKKHLEEHKQQHADSDTENQLIDAIIEKVEAEIPEEMIQAEIDEIINNMAYRLQSQGLNLETYLKYTNMTTDALREQYHEQAEKQVKVRLGLEKIGQLENITASEEEIEEEIKKIAEAYNMTPENVKGMVSAEAVGQDVANRKVIDFIRENAVITEAKEEKAEKKTAKKETAKKEADEEKKPAAKKKAVKTVKAADKEDKPAKAPAKKKAVKKEEAAE